jgi:hypothetical protein
MGRSKSSDEDFSTLAEVQAALFKQVNAAITTQISTTNGVTTLLASGIRDSDIPLLKFLTINAVLSPARLTLNKPVVRIVYNGEPLFQEVTGLLQPLNSALSIGNTTSLVSGSTTFTPFANGFGTNNLSYSTVVDNITSSNFGSVPTAGYALTSAFSFTYSANSANSVSSANSVGIPPVGIFIPLSLIAQ